MSQIWHMLSNEILTYVTSSLPFLNHTLVQIHKKAQKINFTALLTTIQELSFTGVMAF